MPDAVFVLDREADIFDVIELPPPSDEDVLRLCQRVAARVTALFEKRYDTVEDGGEAQRRDQSGSKGGLHGGRPRSEWIRRRDE